MDRIAVLDQDAQARASTSELLESLSLEPVTPGTLLEFVQDLYQGELAGVVVDLSTVPEGWAHEIQAYLWTRGEREPPFVLFSRDEDGTLEGTARILRFNAAVPKGAGAGELMHALLDRLEGPVAGRRAGGTSSAPPRETGVFPSTSPPVPSSAPGTRIHQALAASVPPPHRLPAPSRVLVAEPDREQRMLARLRLRELGLEVLEAGDWRRTCGLLLDEPVDALVVGTDLAPLAPEAMLRTLRRFQRTTRLVYWTDERVVVPPELVSVITVVDRRCSRSEFLAAVLGDEDAGDGGAEAPGHADVAGPDGLLHQV